MTKEAEPEVKETPEASEGAVLGTDERIRSVLDNMKQALTNILDNSEVSPYDFHDVEVVIAEHVITGALMVALTKEDHTLEFIPYALDLIDGSFEFLDTEPGSEGAVEALAAATVLAEQAKKNPKVVPALSYLAESIGKLV